MTKSPDVLLMCFWVKLEIQVLKCICFPGLLFQNILDHLHVSVTNKQTNTYMSNSSIAYVSLQSAN